jgi:hypothetical protein
VDVDEADSAGEEHIVVDSGVVVGVIHHIRNGLRSWDFGLQIVCDESACGLFPSYVGNGL